MATIMIENELPIGGGFSDGILKEQPSPTPHYVMTKEEIARRKDLRYDFEQLIRVSTQGGAMPMVWAPFYVGGAVTQNNLRKKIKRKRQIESGQRCEASFCTEFITLG